MDDEDAGDLAIMVGHDDADGWCWRVVDHEGAVRAAGGAADQKRAMSSALKAAGVHVRAHPNIILGRE